MIFIVVISVTEGETVRNIAIYYRKMLQNECLIIRHQSPFNLADLGGVIGWKEFIVLIKRFHKRLLKMRVEFNCRSPNNNKDSSSSIQ